MYQPPNKKKQEFDRKRLSDAEAAEKLKRDQIASCYDRYTTPQKAMQLAQEQHAQAHPGCAEKGICLCDPDVAAFQALIDSGAVTVTVLS